jgi:Uma2 family endonuclease
MTPDEFLAWDRQQTGRHVYYRGEIFAMAGGSPRHNVLSARMIRQLGAALGRGPCEVMTADQRVATDETHFAFADALVACPPLAFRPGTTDVLTNPRVVVEVLSRSTEKYDRSEKQAAYLAMPSVRHLVLVSQRGPRVEVYTRENGGGFHYQSYGPGSIVRLAALDAAIPVDDLYAGVAEFPGDEDGGEPTPQK